MTTPVEDPQHANNRQEDVGHEAIGHEDLAVAREAEGEPLFQFRLYHLFLATFLVAVICVLAKMFGPGSLPLSIGFSLVGLNALGCLSFLQQQGSRPRVCYLAWLLIAISLFLPVAEGCNNQKIHGWQVAQIAILSQGNAMQGLVTDEQPSDVGDWVLLWHLTLLNLANLLVLCSPLFLFRLQRGQGRLMGNALAISIVSVWLIPVKGEFLIGYYVWASGITLLLQTMRIGWRTICAMAIIGLVTTLIDVYL